MQQKSLKLNFLYNILLQVSQVAFPLITAPYVARVLEPDGVGLFNFANTYANYFALFACLGVPYYGVREIAKIGTDTKKLSSFVSEVMSLLSCSTILCTLLFVISLLFVPQLNENKLIFALSAICLYCAPFKIDWFFRGREEFGYITYRSLILKIIGIIALFTFVHDKNDLIYYVLISVLSSVISDIWNFIKILQAGVKIRFTLDFRKHVKPLLILFSSSLAISVYTILDTLMLGFLTDYIEVGFYNSAAHISKTFVPIAASLAAVAMPRLAYYKGSDNWSEIKGMLDKSLSVVSFMAFPIAFGIAAVAPTFVPLFFGEQFFGSIVPLEILMMLVIVIGLNNLTGVQVLVGLGYDKLFLYSVLTGTITNFLLNLFLIPSYGASGASISSVIAESLILIVTTVFVYKKTPIRFSRYKDMVVSCLFALLFFPLKSLFSNFLEDWLQIFVVVISGSIIYTLMQIFCKNQAVWMVLNVLKNKLHLK